MEKDLTVIIQSYCYLYKRLAMYIPNEWENLEKTNDILSSMYEHMTELKEIRDREIEIQRKNKIEQKFGGNNNDKK